MADRSKRIVLCDNDKIQKINPINMQMLDAYEMDMKMRALSDKSIYSYKTDLIAWFIFILDYQGNLSIKEVKEADIEDFINYCMKQGNNTRRIKRRLSAISAFFKYLKRKKRIEENPMEFIQRPQKDTDVVTQTFLTEEQVHLMFEKLKEYGDLQLEVYAKLSLSTMGRVNAISSITWKQIDFNECVIVDVLEKEEKVVNLFFGGEVKDLLLKLKKQRENDKIENEYVFLVKYGKEYKRATVSALFDWCKKIGQMIEVPTLHPHDFRHSGSQLMLLNGSPIEVISELLNHEGLDVTKKHYTRQNKKKMKAERDKYSII